MSKSTIKVVRMNWATSCIDEAFDRIENFGQSPKDVKKYLLDWLHEMDFDVEIDNEFVNWNGYIIANDSENYNGK